MKFHKSKKITAKHLDLYSLVNEKEMPTGRRKVAFWKGIADKWNDKHPESLYSSWKGPRLAYKRLISRLSKDEFI